MYIGRHFWMVAYAVLFVWGGTAMAQEANKGMTALTECHYKPMPISPEKSARHTTDRMDSLLNLTKKQYDRLYKLNLKWSREDAKDEMPAPRMGGRPERTPDFGKAGGFRPGSQGTRPPKSMAGHRVPRDLGPSPDDRKAMEKHRAKLEKRHKKREKKLKKILTDEQYARWREQRHPVMPADGSDRR